MFRVRTFSVLAALTIGTASTLAACNYSPPGPAVDQPVGLNVDASRVTLLEPGSGEQRVLAYQDIDQDQDVTYSVAEGFAQDVVTADKIDSYTPGDMDTVTTEMKLKGEVEAASEAVEGQQPATRNAFFNVSEPTFSGDKDIASAEGFQFGWRANDDGQMSSLRLAAPQSAADDARAIAESAIVRLTSLPVIFPSEAVGTGAKWTVESRVTGQAAMLQTTTYTIESIEGDVVTLGVDVAQRPTQGALSLDGVGGELEGQELKVLDSTTDSRGTLTVDLTKPLPTAGDVNYTTTVVYGQEESDQGLNVVQTSAAVLSFS